MLNLSLALATAALLMLAFPRFDLAWLAPVALAPLLVAVAREGRAWRRFLLGHAAGVLYWAGTCYWIQSVLEVHGGLGAAASWAAFLVFCLVKALHMAVFAVLAGALTGGSWALAAVPALWVAIERTHGPLGFAWLALGNAGVDMDLPMRLAPYAGVYGLSFVFATMSTALVLVLLRRPRRQFLPALALLLLYALPPLPEARRGSEAAVLVQPNISESAQWTEQWVAAMHRRLVSLSERTLEEGGPVRLIVWPEAPAPAYYYEDARFREMVNGLARRAGAYLLLNVVPHNQQGAPLNSALLVSPSGEPLGRYDKMYLVPFGEFVPWPFGFIRKMSSEAGDFAAGEKLVVLGRFGAFVCYEVVFPHLVRQFAAAGAEVFVNISNDGWYGRTAARDQHLKIARMRAAENRRWLLRATNDGITATIDPAGRLYRHLPSYIEGAAQTKFTYLREQTLYSRFGDWFVALCTLISVTGYAFTFLMSAAKD
ncbi:MAG: apolipoprotein N-acyltransferase [Acidobacteriota bacterium]